MARVGSTVGEALGTTVGAPQGDALSPALLLVYLEETMRTYPRVDLLEGEAGAVALTCAGDVSMLLREKIGVEHREGGGGECECARCRVEITKATLPAHFQLHSMTTSATKPQKEKSPQRCARYLRY